MTLARDDNPMRKSVKMNQALFVSEENNIVIRVFHKLTKLAIMAILTSEALQREKSPVTKYYFRWE